MESGEANLIKKILKPIGKPVSFKYPGKEEEKKGVLKDRVVMKSNPDPMGVQYWDVVDLIEFSDEVETEWIRFGYYRQKGDSIGWASQTTITEPIDIWKELLVKAASEKTWFKELLKNVIAELEEN